MAEYQSNSYRSREARVAEQPKVQERKVSKVVSGTAKTRENKGRKFADIFISEDVTNVKSYIFMDVLVPAIKKAISDIVTDGIDMILYGGTTTRTRTSSGSKVSYRSYSDSSRSRNESNSGYRERGRFDYDEIVFKTRRDAEDVIRSMNDIIAQYNMVRVADMYDLAGLDHPYTSNDYGWVSIRSAEVVHVRDGWVIKLPKAQAID